MRRDLALAAALVAAAALAAAPLGGCDHGREETAALASAVDRFRGASDAEKPAAAEAIAAVRCTDRDVCSAKAECLAVATASVKAAAIQKELQGKLADLHAGRLAPDAPEAAALPGKVDEAEREVAEAKSHVESCDAQLKILQRKHGS